MGRTIFEREIRPNLRPIRVGEQGIAFDRVDLDAVLDEHKSRNLLPQETGIWIKQKSPASIGTGRAVKAASISDSRAMDEFENVLRHSRGLKQRQGSTRSWHGLKRVPVLPLVAESFVKLRQSSLLRKPSEALRGMPNAFRIWIPGSALYKSMEYIRVRSSTVQRELAVVRHILTLASRAWRDEDDRPWLATPLLFRIPEWNDLAKPYPLSFEEQHRFFGLMPPHLVPMAIFGVNTGARESIITGASLGVGS